MASERRTPPPPTKAETAILAKFGAVAPAQEHLWLICDVDGTEVRPQPGPPSNIVGWSTITVETQWDADDARYHLCPKCTAKLKLPAPVAPEPPAFLRAAKPGA